jgi:hypothetical protein
MVICMNNCQYVEGDEVTIAQYEFCSEWEWTFEGSFDLNGTNESTLV